MNILKRYSIVKGETFYSACFLVVNNFSLFVKNNKKGDAKGFGSTNLGTLFNYQSNGKKELYYDLYDNNSIKDRLHNTLVDVLGLNYAKYKLKEQVNYIVESLVESNKEDPVAISTINNMIFKTGCIPLNMEFFHKQIREIQQFFFYATSALTFSAKDGKFINVEAKSLPKKGVDYFCLDKDTSEIISIPVSEIILDEKHNFTRSQVGVLVNLSTILK